MTLELKVTPPENFNHLEIEESFNKMDDWVNAEIRKAHKNAVFHSYWYRENQTYHLSIEYTGSGRVKNFVIKRMIKRMMRKIDKKIKVK